MSEQKRVRITNIEDKELRYLYLDKKLSMKSIAKIKGCSTTPIQLLMIKYEIPRRPPTHLIKGGQDHPLYGKKISLETKMKISKGLTGFTLTKLHKKKLSEAKSGEKHPNWGKHRSYEIRQKISRKLIGKIVKNEAKIKMSITHKGKKLSDETKKKLSDAIKTYYEVHPEMLEARRQETVNRGGKFPKTNTSIEVKIQDFLKGKNIKFKTDYPLLGITRPDVFIPPKLCIYADGDYWHRHPKALERDKQQTMTLKNKGFIVARFWENDINKNFDIVSNNIMNLLESNL